MSGSLKSNINLWCRTTIDPFVLSVIQHGYRIQWNNSTPPPQSEQKNSKNCVNHIDFITKSVEETLLLGVVQETSKEHIHNVLPLNVNVKKNNGSLRLIFDAMFINQFMVVPTFKYPELHKEGTEIFGNSSWAHGMDFNVVKRFGKMLGISEIHVFHNQKLISSKYGQKDQYQVNVINFE